jgi:hypothetical protein
VIPAQPGTTLVVPYTTEYAAQFTSRTDGVPLAEFDVHAWADDGSPMVWDDAQHRIVPFGSIEYVERFVVGLAVLTKLHAPAGARSGA